MRTLPSAASRARGAVASSLSIALTLTLLPSAAGAQEPKSDPTGAPPADAKALATGPKAPIDAPDLGKPKSDATTVSISSGGMLTTGNSRTLALTGSGAFDTRFGDNGLGATLLGNYGHGASAGNAIVATAQNVQGRLRYDRYVIDQASVFLLFTGRHDRFQGLDARLNIDPGFKYLFVKEATTSLWGELGYDFQYDVRRDDARAVLDKAKAPVLDATGQPILLDKTRTDHSTRLFAGFRHAFNKEVTLSLGVEHLQSVVDSTRWRLNFEALAAAKIAGGLAFGVGYTARYDHDPLPGKEELDTTANVNLIYAFSTAAEKSDKDKKACDPCPACPPVGLPPPPAEPSNGAPASGAPAAPVAPPGVAPSTAPAPPPAASPVPAPSAPAATNPTHL